MRSNYKSDGELKVVRIKRTLKDKAILTHHMMLAPDFCYPCSMNKFKTDYGFACPKSGRCEFCCDLVPFVKNIWMKKKSSHYRRRWIEKVLRNKSIDWDSTKIICRDFKKIVQVMMKLNLIKGRNLSRYDYFIIRIISRNGLTGKCPLSLFRDLKVGKTKDVFDDNLFGIVYPQLGWDIECTCPLLEECFNDRRKQCD